MNDVFLQLMEKREQGTLSAEEWKSLQQFLREDGQCREWFVRESQMEALLGKVSWQEEGQQEEQLSQQEGRGGGFEEEYRASIATGEAPGVRPPKSGVLIFAKAALWMIGLSGLGLWSANRWMSQEKANAVVGKEAVLDSGEVALEDQKDGLRTDQASQDSPEGQYEKMLLASVNAGSQTRPPTRFARVQAEAKGIQFNEDIRPLLSENCCHCHGPDAETRKADLRVDMEADVFAAREAGALVVPGKPEESQLYLRITTEDQDDLMPPPDSHRHLSAEDIAKLKQWIEEGAEWQEHWAFEAPVKTPALEVGGDDWSMGEIDRYLLDRMLEEGLVPSEEAPAHVLLRRVSFDLTGLPPSTADMHKYSDLSAEGAYEAMVDDFMGRPSFGEHRARYWLDAARYADTHGLHLDNYRVMWPYRDWVVDAYNNNQPFDQFTVEQLAGDLLEAPTQSQLIATGFNRCNVTTSEGGSIEEELLSRYAVDRVETTSTVWMGLTTGCAACHDHKFDPVSQKEFYQLYAYFNHTTQPGFDKNTHDSIPNLRLFNPQQKKQKEALEKKVKVARAKVSKLFQEHEGAYQAWLKSDLKSFFSGRERVPLAAGVQSFLAPALQKEEGGIADTKGRVWSWNGKKDGNKNDIKVDASGKPLITKSVWRFEEGTFLEWQAQGDATEEEFWLKAIHPAKPFSIMLRMQVPDARHYRLVSFEGQGGQEVEVFVEKEQLGIRIVGVPGVEELQVWSDFSVVNLKTWNDIVLTYDGSGSPEGIAIYSAGKKRFRFPVIVSQDLNVARPFELTKVRFGNLNASQPSQVVWRDFAVADTCFNAEEVMTNLRALNSAHETSIQTILKDKKDAHAVKRYYLALEHEDYLEALADFSRAETELSRHRHQVPLTLVMQEKPEGVPVAHVLERGEYDKPGEEVGVGVPAALPAMKEGMPGNRLGLAQWLVDGEHPLMARVVVNRMWQEIFGTGIVRTSEDFGIQGEVPSHPKLLDYLAVSFRESGWDMKALYKEMLMSAAYRQSSKSSPKHLQIDPDNRLLARGPRYRFDAEMIRDQALGVSGLLHEQQGGPAVRPYQPEGVWKAVGYTNSNTQTFHPDRGLNLFRRSLYTFWKRTAPPPSMAAFDAPSRESCTVRRERTNTPLQALVLMNDPQFMEAAKFFALRGLQAMEGEVTGAPKKSLESGVQFLFQEALGRKADAREMSIMQDQWQKFFRAYDQSPELSRALLGVGEKALSGKAAGEQWLEKHQSQWAAWTMAASQVMNLDEFINRH